MTANEQEVERLRGILREALRKVPARVNGGSIQSVRDYKDAYKRAVKAVDKSKATSHELQMLINQVS
jgi:hypothetical protein